MTTPSLLNGRRPCRQLEILLPDTQDARIFARYSLPAPGPAPGLMMPLIHTSCLAGRRDAWLGGVVVTAEGRPGSFTSVGRCLDPAPQPSSNSHHSTDLQASPLSDSETQREFGFSNAINTTLAVRCSLLCDTTQHCLRFVVQHKTGSTFGFSNAIDTTVRRITNCKPFFSFSGPVSLEAPPSPNSHRSTSSLQALPLQGVAAALSLPPSLSLSRSLSLSLTLALVPPPPHAPTPSPASRSAGAWSPKSSPASGHLVSESSRRLSGHAAMRLATRENLSRLAH
jgi:hypothetical protein